MKTSLRSRCFTARRALAALAGLSALVVASACGDGYSTQDAYERCQQERHVKATVTDAAFTECVACHEDCGLECRAAGSSPERYSCPE